MANNRQDWGTKAAILGAAAIFTGGLGALAFASAATAFGWVAFSGAVISVAGALMQRPAPVHGPDSSATYSVDRFSNPVGPDHVLSVVYGTHRIVPVILQEYVSALSDTGSAGGVNRIKTQGLSILCAVAEGELSDIADIRLNGQPVFSDPIVDEVVGYGTGSKTKWNLAGRYAYLPGLTIKVNGAAVTNTTLTDTQNIGYRSFTPTANTTYMTLRVTRPRGDRILSGTIKVYVDGELKPSGGPYFLVKVNDHHYNVIYGGRVSGNFKFVFQYVSAGGMGISQAGNGTTSITFGTAPTSGQKITASYRRAHFRGLRIETRMGTLEQEPIAGFNDTRRSKDYNTQFVRDVALAHNTNTSGLLGVVNDVCIGLVAPRGFTILSEDGGSKHADAKFAIRYALLDSSGNIDTKGWRNLYQLGSGDSPQAVFTLLGDTTSKRVWEVSVRETLRELVSHGYPEISGFNLEDELEALDGGTRVRIEVTRKDAVNGTSNQLHIDFVDLGYVTEVSDERYSYPGTALLAIKATIDEGLQGSVPFIECTATRAPLYDPRTGEKDGDSNNPALAVYDLITSGHGEAIHRYGSLGHFTADDVFVGEDGDALNSLWAFADWCEEQVDTPGGATEARHQIDLVLDSPMSLSEVIADICAAARCMVVQQGVTWKFPIDRDGDPVFTFTDSADVPNANIVEGSFSMGPESIGSKPTDVEIEYFDGSEDYQRRLYALAPADLEADEPRNPLRFSARGVVRATEIDRLGHHTLDIARNDPTPCTWRAHPGAQLVEAGDIVTVVVADANIEAKVRVLAIGREGVSGDEEGGFAPPQVRYVGRVMSAQALARSSGGLRKGQVGRPMAGTRTESSETERLATIRNLRGRVA